MDPHVHWLRRRLLSALLRRSLAVFVLAAIGSAAAFVAADRPLIETVPWAAIVGQVAVGLLLAWSLFTNPLDVRYLRSFLANPRRLEAVAPDDVDPDLEADLAELGLAPLATIWDDTDAPYPAFDLFQSPRRMVTAAWTRTGAGLSLYSRLDDGRVLVTDSTTTTPHRKLVVNFSPRLGDDYFAPDMAALHHNAIEELGRHGVGVRADDGDLFFDALSAEHDAYRAIGSLLGAFFNPTARRHRLRLSVTARPRQLLDLALTVGPPPRASRRRPPPAPAIGQGPTAARYPRRNVGTPATTNRDRGTVGAPGRSQPQRHRGHRNGDHGHQPARHR